MLKQKQKIIIMIKKNILKKVSSIVAAVAVFIAIPVLAAIFVQNFMTFDVVVKEPPVIKELGGDANSTQYLTVDLGGTISNQDTANGNTATFLSNEKIEFACFAGDRTYYTDVIQLKNTTGTENWKVALRVEADIQGNPAVSDTFTDPNNDGGDADIWLFNSTSNSQVNPISELPNPANIGSLADWNNNPVQLEIINNQFSTTTGNLNSGTFTVPAGESRQLGLVVDCGANMMDEAGITANKGTFRVTVEATI